MKYMKKAAENFDGITELTEFIGRGNGRRFLTGLTG
jgi:hypothetical protein